MTNKTKRRFIHLSDIHFSNSSATFGFDPDRSVRGAIVADIAEMREALGDTDAILITGDIAYAGKREEFDDAAIWLEEICEAAGCGNEAVLMCPGNHDVDQNIISKNPLIQDGHDAVRRGRNQFERDRALTARLIQPDARALFYSPIAAYNDFAARYQSSFFADTHSFAWEHDFTLNDGSALRIRGLNSALLSGLSDIEGGLFLSTRAWTIPKKAGIEYMIMSHHPPAWLADGREAERAFEGGARIQLFGHEHDQRVVPGRDWVKLFAGAVNPHRAEPNWRPGYNIIEVSVNSEPTRTLVVETHAREWQGTPPQFRSIEDIDHNPVFGVNIKLGPLPKKVQAAKFDLNEERPGPATSDLGGLIKATAMDPDHRFRLLVYRFFRLSLSKKAEVVGHLRLVEESDSRLTDVERFKLSLMRAKEKGLLDNLEKFLEVVENN